MVREAVATDEGALRVWSPPKQVAFGRRDCRASGYERARTRARQRGYLVVEREVGGRAVAFTGRTLSFVHVDPGADQTAIQSRYAWALDRLQTALATLGVDVREGEPDGAFCPGTHSLSAEGKVVGLAQRVRADAAITAGVVTVGDHDEIAAVLGPVYDALSVPFDADSVGSVARAGGPDDPEIVGDAVVDALTD